MCIRDRYMGDCIFQFRQAQNKMEAVGGFERALTDIEKEAITKFLKFDEHVPFRIVQQVYYAETESEYFYRAGALLATLASLAFFKFPVIRQMNVYPRIFTSLIPGYFIWRWGSTTAEDLRWGRVYASYQKFMTYHGLHQKVFF
eukprot:TRINITY_DN1733_c0_g1_i11.p1 TRINITY_DN1733_c0_g1~~TRINITY_DN1733_c0_g1_i11.p1  ORF type:complete len:144 (-),score=33.83 TRINITY_DN1733_c0_g1_i11:169-600(-)